MNVIFPLAEVSLAEMSGEALRARIAQAQLYLIEMTATAPAEHIPRQVECDHLAYLHKLDREGRLYGSGPVGFSTAPPAHDLAIVAAATAAEAERISKNDPLVKAGFRQSNVRVHTMNEGVACYVGRAMSKRAEARGDSFDPDISVINLPYDDLVRRAVGAELFLISLDSTDKPRPPEDASTGHGHFVWLRTNEMAAKLMSCGPVQLSTPPGAGIWGGGLAVVATRRAEAEQIAAVEPSGLAGYRKLTVQSWRMDYGLAAPLGKVLETLNAL
jgi:uncharacterized protein YciI